MRGLVRIREQEGNLQVMDVSNLVPGIYWVETEGNHRIFVKR